MSASLLSNYQLNLNSQKELSKETAVYPESQQKQIIKFLASNTLIFQTAQKNIKSPEKL